MPARSSTELHLWDWSTTPKEIWNQDIADVTYQVAAFTGWEGDGRFGLQLVDGRKATVAKDKGVWHYAASGTPRPPQDAPR